MSEAMIFVVEDEASFVEALSIGLKREGFDVAVAVDGAEALDRYDSVQPDLVLLDVMLPKVSGVDVCRQLRKRTQVPIIMVTAKSAEIDTVVGLEVGADDYVAKPYRLRELIARIRAVLRRADSSASAPIMAPGMLKVGDVRDFTNFMGAVIDTRSFDKHAPALDEAKALNSALRLARQANHER